MFMREANYGDQERMELMDHASRTLAQSLSQLPGSSGVAQACVYLLRHLSRSAMQDFVSNCESEFIVS
jgi:hypothetical protein